MLSKARFKEEIELHPALTKNPYAKKPHIELTRNEVKNIIFQLSVFSEKFLQKFSLGRSRSDLLRDTAAALPIEAREFGNFPFGDIRHATRETRHCLHQLERSYGSTNSNVNAGATAALKTWESYWIHGEEAAQNFWIQLIIVFERYNRGRAPHGLRPLPIDFFTHHIARAKEYGDCFGEACAHISTISDFNEMDWRRGASMALDAVHLFCVGLFGRG